MRNQNDAKYVLAAFGPLCLLLSGLVIHYRGLLKELQENVYPPRLVIQSFKERDIEFTTNFYGLRYSGESTNLIDLNILYFGAFEKPLLMFLKDVAGAIRDEPIIFVDVGANTGQHTIFASRFSRQVHAFEPFPTILERLHAAVDMNSLTNVTIHPIGLGASESLLDFREPPKSNHGLGSFVANFAPSLGDVIQLRVVNGDSYFRETGITAVDLIKIDVEGYEQPVLKGLRTTMESTRPVAVMALTVGRDVEDLFTSEQQLRDALPSGYVLELLQNTGSAMLSGEYVINPFQVDFSLNSQFTVIAYPD
ncbi:MAG: FkbM family methyltransferase [Acidobacteria bacterium]|nr:FkbM family methyltransferase [Acidobacteriota bacterium]MDA1234087.1 FkbM family methyltransferase [Acidobacteriota bacterium]